VVTGHQAEGALPSPAGNVEGGGVGVGAGGQVQCGEEAASTTADSSSSVPNYDNKIPQLNM